MNYQTDGNFHTDLIELLARRMRPSLYVELGVGDGEWTIRRVARFCGRAVGVDIAAPAIRDERYAFHHGTTEQFIRETLPSLGPVELAFIDADHSAAAVEADFLGLLPYVALDGVVVLHDTYPENEHFVEPQRCGDCWTFAMSLRHRAVSLGIEVMTLPCPPGLTLVRRRARHLLWNIGSIT